MRKLWTDHVVWTRDYIIAAVDDKPDAEAASKQDVEVFKRDARHVRAHQPGQRLERRRES